MKTIEKPVQNEIKIKKSQFICRLYPANNKKEGKKIIQEISSKYSDATHNCTAYIVSDGEGFDDNGEPSGTAGKPMINALRKNNLHNIVAIVTRYFGGIKLGSGGLVRAYSKSVLEAIKISEIIEIEYYDVYELIFDYSDIKFIEQELRKNHFNIINKEYKEDVVYKIAIKNSIDKFKEKIKNKVKLRFIEKKPFKKI